MKKYPFKFLDAYGKEDQDIFFGREEETDELYRMVFQTNLLLVYGASGTGKTSLIRCGLANRFKSSQWLDLYIRRGGNINQSLLDTVVKNTPSTAAAVPLEKELDWFENLMEAEQEGKAAEKDTKASRLETENPIARALNELYLATFTPIYLIFDQFEELYTLGKAEEQRRFTEIIEELVQLPLPLKIIIVIREEYLAKLYDLERAVPQLRDKKLRIEPMGLQGVEQVILNATVNNPESNIALEADKETEIARAIVDKIREEDVNIKLPYLQVFMDQLYEKATGEAVARSEEATFTLGLVNNIGNIGDVLADFIERQSHHIYRQLALKYPGLPADVVWRILSPFATVDGTKAPIRQDELPGIRQALNLPPGSDTKSLIKEAVVELENRRILRYRKEENTYEVAHDTLALQIAEKRSEEEKAYLKARRMATESYATYQDTRTLLSREQLAFIHPYEARLQEEVAVDVWDFITYSKSRRRRQQALLWMGVAAAFVVAFVVIFVVLKEQEKAEAAQKIAESAQKETAEALKQLQNSIVVREALVKVNLQKADQEVLNLKYEDALVNINAAAALKALKDSVAQAYLEIAFWYNEAGDIHRAVGILDSAAVLADSIGLQPYLAQLPDPPTRDELRTLMEQFDSATYQALKERYYPIMIAIPGGTFTMGCDPGIDPSCEPDEILHQAKVSGFQIAKYETTWWQYYLFCQAAGYDCQAPPLDNSGNTPAILVSWYDAVAYANWVSAQQDVVPAISGNAKGNYRIDVQSPGYRLPTEAEWEYAAKGGKLKQQFIYSGHNTLDSVGWNDSASDSHTQPVGLLKANAFGLYDMSGNVWEWCWDWYGPYPSNLQVNYDGPPSGSSRILRGGSCLNRNFSARVANRSESAPDIMSYNYGFRLSRFAE